MIIVTGGAGFIGSNLVLTLNKIGITDIIIVDNLKNSFKHRNLKYLKYKDLVHKDSFINSFKHYKKIDLIFHQGACSNTLETDTNYMMNNNYEYSKILLEHCIEKKIRFIYASSASVYGHGENGFTEDVSSENPLNIYAYTKYLFDQYVRKHVNVHDSQIVGLRYFNVYGPQENHKERMASVIYHFYNQIKSNSSLKIFEGSERLFRDFVHINNIIDVILYFYNNSSISGIFNCGTGTAESFYKIAKIFKKKYKCDIIEIPFPEDLKGKYQKNTVADMTKLRNTGYNKKFISLKKGVLSYVNALEKNGGYYES